MSDRSGSAAIDFAVQSLLRLLPVALWLDGHAKLCADAGGSRACIVCALRSCRGDFGKQLGQTMQLPRFSLGYTATAGQAVHREPVEYLLRLLDAMRSREVALGNAVLGSDGRGVSHVDRLFQFWREKRRECLCCHQKSVFFEPGWVWRVSTVGFEAAEVTVQELYLSSCAETMVDAPCARCGRMQSHREQQRLASLPNMLLVQVMRSAEGQSSDGDIAVLAEDHQRQAIPRRGASPPRGFEDASSKRPR